MNGKYSGKKHSQKIAGYNMTDLCPYVDLANIKLSKKRSQWLSFFEAVSLMDKQMIILSKCYIFFLAFF